MFKPIAVAIVSSLVALVGSYAQELPRAPTDVPRAFERYFNAADLDSLLQLYGKESVFVPAPGVILQSSEKIRGALVQFMAAKLPIKLTVNQVYEANGTALIVFDWEMKGTGADGKSVRIAGTGADVVVRQSDGTWRYAIDNPFGVAQPKK